MGILRLVTFVFFPIIRISGFPVPLAMFYIFLRKIEFYKSYFYPLFFSSLYFLFMIVLNNFEQIEITDLAYSIFPLVYLVLIHSFYKLKNLEKIIKIYFFFNIGIVSITWILNYTPYILSFYYNNYVFGNITSENHYMRIIENRGIGLVGHPAWLGLMSYLLGKFLSIKENKYKYVLFSFISITLSGARAALFILVLLEAIGLIIKNRKNLVKLAFFLTIFIIAISIGFSFVYHVNDSFRYWIEITMLDLKYGNGFRSDSIAHRIEMFTLLFENNLISILFGGGILSESINILETGIAIDSELVLRTLQYGLLGYFMLFLPIFVAMQRAKKFKNEVGKEITIFILLFSFLGSLTTTILSNMIFIIYISIMIAIVEQINASNYNKIG